MIDVHDEIADLEITQVGQKRPRQIAALLRRTVLFLEDVRLRVHLQPRLGKTESARQQPGGHEHRCSMRVLRVLDRDREDVVLPQDLDRALGPPAAVGDQKHRVASFPRLADIGHPVRDPSAELQGWLTRDVARCAVALVILDREFLEPRRCRQSRCEILPTREQLRRWKSGGTRRVAEAGFQLLTRFERLFLDLLVLGHEHAQTMCLSEKGKDRHRVFIVVEPFADEPAHQEPGVIQKAERDRRPARKEKIVSDCIGTANPQSSPLRPHPYQREQHEMVDWLPFLREDPPAQTQVQPVKAERAEIVGCGQKQSAAGLQHTHQLPQR